MCGLPTTLLAVIPLLTGVGPPARVDLPRGHYYLAQSEPAPTGSPLPLVMMLHGTDTRASEMLAFWRAMPFKLPCILVAPQSSAAGWNDTDVVFLRDVIADVRADVPHDPSRVLLTGHSAGGAMAFHLLFVEDFPATALAVTACYLPPTIAAAHIKSRRNVPVYYAAGMRDLNRNRLLAGLTRLRDAGVRVTVGTNQARHVLDRTLTSGALAWFENLGRVVVESRLRTAARVYDTGARPGDAMAMLEEMVEHRVVYFPDQVERAEAILATLLAKGHAALGRASESERRHLYLVAHRELLGIEQRYTPGSIAVEARSRRQSLERKPEVASVLGLHGSPPPTREDKPTGVSP
jgi:hypothetical protein